MKSLPSSSSLFLIVAAFVAEEASVGAPGEGLYGTCRTFKMGYSGRRPRQELAKNG